MAPSSYNGSNAGNYGNRAKILARSCSFHGQTNAENNVHRRALVTFYNGRCNGAAPNAIYTDCVMRSLRYIAGLQFRFTLAESIYGIRQNRAYAHIILWNIYTPSIALTRTLYLGPSMLAFFHVCSSAICIMKKETLYYLAWNVYSCRATVYIRESIWWRNWLTTPWHDDLYNFAVNAAHELHNITSMKQTMKEGICHRWDSISMSVFTLYKPLFSYVQLCICYL